MVVAGADRTRRPELDGLRGLAVLAVMAYHFNLPGAQHGFIGVDVFFVLSGFLITSIIAGEWRRSSGVDWRRFYLRRGARLLPAFWLMLLVTLPIVAASSTLVSAAYAMNWSMALHWSNVERALGHTWSLAVEWQFYLLWPFVLVAALSRWDPRRVALATVLVAVASASWRTALWMAGPDWLRVFTGTDTHADSLLVGSAVALAVTFGMPFRVNRWVPVVGLQVAVLLVVLPRLPFGFFAVAGIPVAIAATAAVIASPGLFRGPLSFGPLRAVGLISYGLYLWHVPIWIWLLDSHVQAPAVVATVLTFTAAALSYRYLEQPFLRLGRDRPVDEVAQRVQVSRRPGLRPVDLELDVP